MCPRYRESKCDLKIVPDLRKHTMQRRLTHKTAKKVGELASGKQRSLRECLVFHKDYGSREMPLERVTPAMILQRNNRRPFGGSQIIQARVTQHLVLWEAQPF